MKTLTLPTLRVWAISLCLVCHTLVTIQGQSDNSIPSAPTPGLILQMISNEAKEIDGSLEIPVRLTAMANMDLAGWQLILTPPSTLPGAEAVIYPLPKQKLERGASRQVIIRMPYDPERLPYHHQRLRLSVQPPGQHRPVSAITAYVYFTPYGTVETWDATDFDNLKRVWISRLDLDGKRKKTSRKEIPVSDLTDEEFIDDHFPRDYRFVEGLAYGVPVRSKQQKSAKSGNTYSGRISGRIITVIDGDTTALTDIQVDVHNKKGGKIETTWTDNTGHFFIDANAVSLNGDSLELYVKVQAINEAETIRVRGRGLGPTRKEFYLKNTPFLWHYQDGDVHMGDIDTDENELKGQLLHWANRARLFVEDELQGSGFSFPTTSGEKLEIMTHPWQQDMGGMFMPAHVEAQLQAGAIVLPFPLDLLGIVVLENVLSNKDCLYIGEDSEERDGTVSHEFGHYLMWHLQDEHWAGLFEAGLAMHSTKFNNKTADLAWTEGFANGFADIMEAVNVMQGHAPVWNSGLENNLRGYDLYDNYEDSIYVIDTGGGNMVPGQGLDHGFVSEYYIGQLIYDLWDGPTVMADTTLTSAAYDDTDGLSIQDSIELSFRTIVQPILDHPGVGGGPGLFGFGQSASVINSIPEYHQRLLFEQPFDCLERKEVHELFNFNKIHNIRDGVWAQPLLEKHYLNLDAISYVGDVETNRYDITNGYKLDGTNVETFILDVTELPNSVSSYNLYGLGPDAGFVQLLDDLTVNGGARLFLNKDDTHGWLDAGNYYSQATTPGTLPPTNNLDVEICGGMTMVVTNGGELILGDPAPNSNKRAEMRFTAGSTLMLGPGGILKIHSGSRLIIEPGATFIYQKDAEIQLPAGNSILQIEGEWILDNQAVFDFDGWGFVRTNLPDNNGGPNIIHRPGSSIALIGEQKDEHKMLEVVAGSHFMTQHDDCNMSVHFEEGIIEMGADARINLTDSQFSMHRAWLREIPGSTDKHRGIFVNRAALSITDSDFEDGTTGLEVLMDSLLMNCSGVPTHMNITASTFSNCDTGLSTFGGSVDLEAVVFHDNDMGWRADQVQGDCFVGLNTAYNHRKTAYDLRGSAKAYRITINESYIYRNRLGLAGEGLELDLNCDSIANNRVGILAINNAQLLMNDEAYNYVGGNNRTIVLKRAGGIDLEDGFNYLDNTGPLGAALNVIEGSLLTPPATTPIPADHNFWRASVFGGGSFAPSAAFIDVWLAGSPGTTYNFSDPTPLPAPVGGPVYCRLFAGGGGPVPASRLTLSSPATATTATLGQNIPNPGRQRTRIPFYLPLEVGEARIQIFDLVTGRIISRHPIQWRGDGELSLQRGRLSPGVYGYSLITDGQVIATRRLIWVD